MNPFTRAERAYLGSQKLARLATIGPDGAPQVRPVGFGVDEATGAIDVAGHRIGRHKSGATSCVTDAFPSSSTMSCRRGSPARSRCAGVPRPLPDQAGDGIVPGAPPGVIRIHPIRILAFGIEEGGPGTRTVDREPTQPG